MTAQLYTPVVHAPNAEHADAYYRLWGSYLGGMPARERERQERAGVITPRRLVTKGKTSRAISGKRILSATSAPRHPGGQPSHWRVA